MKTMEEEKLPSTFSLFGLILLLSSLTWGLQGGEFAPIMDCDETFNYLEAAHYSLHGTGMQTWEYAAQYGLRSWFYIELHLAPLRALQFFFSPLAHNKVYQVLFLRGMLAMQSIFFESMLASAVGAQTKSRNAALLSAFALGASTGMGHARRSFLPSSTCMMCFTLAQALWMRGRKPLALLAGSFSVLVAWPFAALPFVPIGLDVLLYGSNNGNERKINIQRGVLEILPLVTIAILLFGVLPGLVDSWYYRKPMSATLQMILYNALGSSGGGAHLYGVEDWTFYLKNLVLNFNVWFPLSALASVFAVRPAVRTYHSLAFLLTFAMFQAMAHKEERFLFVLYPTICWSAAVLIAPYRRLSWALALFVFLPLTVSRNLALGRLTAATEVYSKLDSNNSSGLLCLGREWHRFPSSFYLPQGVELAWTKSDFGGILPQPFASKADFGYSRLVPNMNDKNKQVISRFVNADSCKYTVDLDLAYSSADALQPFAAAAAGVWRKLECRKFADAPATKQPFRSFALWSPSDHWWLGVEAREYCLFEKI